MGFFDSAQDVFDKGVSAARGAVSGVAVEQQGFMKAFVRLCNDGWLQGWHERNGGNLSYRLTDEEVASCRSFFYAAPSSWVRMEVRAERLAGAYFAVTGSGKYMRNVSGDPSENVGIIEINTLGDAWRLVWGLKDGGKPTSEMVCHFINHAVRMGVTDGAARVMYHAHPAHATALTFVLPAESKPVTRALWGMLPECAVVFPEGVGVVPYAMPGGLDLAQQTASALEKHQAALWAQHGVFCSGATFDEAFGLMHTIEKAAEVYMLARAAQGGSAEFAQSIGDDDLRALAAAYNLPLNEEYLG